MGSVFVARVAQRQDYGCLAEIVLDTGGDLGAQPGQFLQIRCGDGGRILRRPFSLLDCRAAQASILVKKAGPGSRWLAAREKGDKLDCMGPLGRGFDFARDERPALVAGGAGIAPLVFLFRRMAEKGVRARVFWGIESEIDYQGLPARIAEELRAGIACEDGSVGFAGNVLGLFRSETGNIDSVYACGPKSMLTALEEMLRGMGRLKIQISFEERMACGLGACRGCAVPASNPAGTYLTVCSDGPVFAGEELDWERIKNLI